LSGLTIDGAYQVGVIVGGTNTGSAHGAPSGCNLQITGSHLSNVLHAIWSVGDVVNGMFAAVTAGNGTDLGKNVIESIYGKTAVGVLVWDGTSYFQMSKNEIRDSRTGIALYPHWAAAPPWDSPPRNDNYVFTSNVVSGMTSIGLVVGNRTVVSKLLDNTFTNNTSNGSGAPAIALSIDSVDVGEPSFPRVQYARRNTFVGNDVGIAFTSNSRLVDSASLPAFDFGTPSDPGNNVISCNSTASGQAGFDLEVNVPTDGVIPLAFYGNAWDHTPPLRTDLSSPSSNGGDVATAPAWPALKIDLGGPTLAAACQGGHVR
jgi:hypothetical protein